MTSKTLNISVNGPENRSMDEIIALLECALEGVRDGEITSVAVVACMKDGFGASFAGTQGAELNLGLDSLKASILKAIHDPSSKSKILRAR